MNGIIVINKEKNFTSFDVVAIVRKLLQTKKVGHTGTLDPNATGVLPVLLGSATKAQDIIPNHDKSYIANFMFGIETDTLDIWGNELRREKTDVKTEEILHVLEYFKGDIMQVPPMFSSISVNGKRLYQLAREGEIVDREARPQYIYEIKLLSFDEEKQTGSIYVKCNKGTYVRTLIDDVSKKLGTIGVMTDLQRTVACSYKLEGAVTIDELRRIVDSGEVDQYIKSVESLFVDYSELVVTDAQAHRFKNGNPLDLKRTRIKNIVDKEVYRVKDRSNNFISLGIVDIDKQELKMYKHF